MFDKDAFISSNVLLQKCVQQLRQYSYSDGWSNLNCFYFPPL